MRLTTYRKMKRFVGDHRGNVMILFGFTGIIALGAAGGAVDFGRWMHAKHHTSRAMDAAVLAGARALQLNHTDPSAALVLAKNIYDGNVSKRMMLKNDTVQFITANNNTAVTATGNASLQTTLLGILGISELPVVVANRSRFPKAKIVSGGGGSGDIEVALMLDVTSSMCDSGVGSCTTDTKIQGLKEAAKDLVNIVVQTDQNTYTSRVAVVPFSTSVRVGPNGGGANTMVAMTNLPATWSGYTEVCTQSTGNDGTYDNETGTTTGSTYTCTQTQPVLNTNWKVIPCVTDRMYDSGSPYDYTDVAPGGGHWMNANEGSRWPLAEDSASASVAGRPSGATSATPTWQWNYNSDGSCWEAAEANEIVPLSSNKAALAARIDGLEANGATAGALGTAFAWYALSPQWQTIWPNDSRPGDYSKLAEIQSNGKPRLRKVAVLMTDGGYNTYRGWKGQNQQTVSTHATQLCTNMKAAGIEIYAVGFALDQLPLAERTIARATLQACGTDLQHFYETLNVQQLKDAFTEIAMSMSTIYLSD